jgi:2-desacetyl-2-hydroxyethyl bacteriochlorophyllide A dehydrogenase
MKAVLYEKPRTFGVARRDLRPLKAGEVLLKVNVCGVCGTDVHIVEGESRSTPPVVLGHEYAGAVADTGPGVERWKPGQTAAVDPNISCGSCGYCRKGLVHLCANLRALGVDIDGGMAEFCIVPENQLYEIPSNLSVSASAFIEPVSCAVHGIDRSSLRPGDTVVILGGGTVGLIMFQLAKAAGAARAIVVEPLPRKQEIARALRADLVLDPEDAVAAVFDLTGIGADVVIECVGRTATMRESLSYIRRGGTAVFFGVCPVGASIPVEPNDVYFRELSIVGSYVNPRTFSRSIELLKSGTVRVDAFDLHEFPLEGVHEALEYQRTGKTIKSMILPGS